MKNTQSTTKQMLTEVDKFIKDIGLTNEMLNFKDRDEKLLYYHNFVDPENNFRGLWELPNLYYIKLANLLCNTEERLEEFTDIFCGTGDIAEGLRKYRRYLIDSRNEEYNQELLKLMQKQIHSKNYEKLYDTLKELFLEPFDEWIMERIVEKIEQELTTEDLFNWYLKGNNIKSIINFELNFIKTA